MAAAALDNHDITQLLDAWRGGDGGAREALMTLVYGNVRAIAASSLRHSPGATLTPTEIAHEALLRLLGGNGGAWHDRRHFFHVVAQATRQVLVDAARRRHADKRGGAAEHVAIEAAEHLAANDADADLLRVDAALSELARSDERRARTVELAYFGGFSREEIAAALAVSEGTVDRDLRLARAWLKQALTT
jgi:RNA polymerase sigma factor (TIGR02999 family)